MPLEGEFRHRGGVLASVEKFRRLLKRIILASVEEEALWRTWRSNLASVEKFRVFGGVILASVEKFRRLLKRNNFGVCGGVTLASVGEE